MSARDSESGSSTYKGGSGSAGGLGNGGVGGGSGSGGGGGAGRNGGYNSRTGMQTGTTMRGASAAGRPGGPALGYGMNPAQARAAAAQAAAAAVSKPRNAGVVGQPTVVPVSAPPPVGMAPPAPLADPMAIYTTLKPVPATWSQPGLTTADWWSTNSNINSPIATGHAYSPADMSGVRPVSTVQRGAWPGQNTYYGRGQAGKVFDNDRVPQGDGFSQSGSYRGNKQF